MNSTIPVNLHLLNNSNQTRTNQTFLRVRRDNPSPQKKDALLHLLVTRWYVFAAIIFAFVALFCWAWCVGGCGSETETKTKPKKRKKEKKRKKRRKSRAIDSHGNDHAGGARSIIERYEKELQWKNGISQIQHVEFGGPGENMVFWKHNKVF